MSAGKDGLVAAKGEVNIAFAWLGPAALSQLLVSDLEHAKQDRVQGRELIVLQVFG